MTSYTQPDFVQIWQKKISQPICIRNVWYMYFAVRFYKTCSPMSLTVLLSWQHTRFQTSPYQKLFEPPLPFHFDICYQHFICMIQQAHRYVSLGLWPCLTFFKLKITYILKSSGWGLEKSELPWERNFL